MANISDANGKIMIECDSKEVLLELERCFEVAESWYYSTNLEDECEKQENTSTFKESAEYEFYGTGRWSYQNNIESFFRWLTSHKETLNWKLLEDSDFVITFDYTDEECGERFIYKATDKLVHKADDKLPEGISFVTEDYQGYEYNIVNLVKVCGYDFWEEFEACFGSDSYLDDNDIFSILFGEKESIEEYFQKPLGQLFKEHGYNDVIKAYNHKALELGEATI